MHVQHSLSTYIIMMAPTALAVVYEFMHFSIYLPGSMIASCQPSNCIVTAFLLLFAVHSLRL